ncbi:MAG: hypothetical protein JRI23_12420 [Deltaproteobacteria bacterium]|jgi:hypothetical protein|nr:hypothetical protein [Deltaproteobacteria bacterium]MBW2532517.1 hypothetical protein [Deltaproteobacteria bacterium]
MVATSAEQASSLQVVGHRSAVDFGAAVAGQDRVDHTLDAAMRRTPMTG